jgi:leader peptidase (prepilin peptidase) / N-methyltransferase
MDWEDEFLRHHGPFGLPFHLWTLTSLMLGLMVGSFLNVVIHRMPAGLSVIRPPSHCPACQWRIPLRLNLPVISWLWLRGRCANCDARISPRYLFVELLTGALFVTCWLRWGEVAPLAALAAAILLAGFVAATFIDFAHFIIPDEITIGGIVAGFLLSTAAPELHRVGSIVPAMRSSGLGIVVGAALVYGVLRLGKLLFGREHVDVPVGTRVIFHDDGIRLPDRELAFEEIFYRKSDTIVLRGRHIELADRGYAEGEVRLSPNQLRVGTDTFDPEQEPYLSAEVTSLTLPREAMGLGDVKFMAAIGAFLGWQATVFSLLLSAVVGALVGVVLIALRRQHVSGRLPYGPYIAFAATAWLFGGSAWWDYWAQDIRFPW